jgi:hypothetical protein
MRIAPQAFSAPDPSDAATAHADIIRFKVIEALMDIRGTSPWLTTVNVSNRIVELSSVVEDETALEPSRAAIANIAHVVEVKDHRSVVQSYGRG